MPDDVKILSNIAAGGALRITGLDHVVLRVADLERSIAFYGDVLGCPIERSLEQPKLVQLRAGTSMIDLVPCGDGEDSGPQHGPFRGAHRPHGRAGDHRASEAPRHRSRRGPRAAMAPRDTARRSTLPIRTATRSSLRARPKPRRGHCEPAARLRGNLATMRHSDRDCFVA